MALRKVVEQWAVLDEHKDVIALFLSLSWMGSGVIRDSLAVSPTTMACPTGTLKAFAQRFDATNNELPSTAPKFFHSFVELIFYGAAQQQLQALRAIGNQLRLESVVLHP